MRDWFLQLYPFIHTFPKFLAEALIKVEDEYSRSFLIDNIRVEKAHAEHWLWMGEGFGIPRQEMIAIAEGDRPILRDVQSLTDWIWYINAKGSLAEAVAATSFAIEGATGDLTRTLLRGFEAYGSREGVNMNPRTTKWFRNHAKYDDDHPRIALEIVTRNAQTDRARMKVMTAARRSLQLLNLALLTSSRAYSAETASAASFIRERRATDRRQTQASIAFPDRRITDRRGTPVPLKPRHEIRIADPDAMPLSA
jgi:pyrroloquinoline quinone (PQQ) biosynthesis protein C